MIFKLLGFKTIQSIVGLQIDSILEKVCLEACLIKQRASKASMPPSTSENFDCGVVPTLVEQLHKTTEF